jgi:hypothetical protein
VQLSAGDIDRQAALRNAAFSGSATKTVFPHKTSYKIGKNPGILMRAGAQIR